jgi:DNA adenine methylase
MMPAHHTYVEVFAGAAWVLVGKDRDTSKSEVLNDLDGELINFWRVIKHRPAEFSESASWLLPSRQLWGAWESLPGVGGEVLRAIRFYAVIRLGFGSQRIPTSFGSRNVGRPRTNWPSLRKEARAIVQRLREVWIENLPWEKCLDKFDAADTFFYLDPPYHCGARPHHLHTFTEVDHQSLAGRLARVKGKWLLSYNDDAFIRSLYNREGLVMESVSVPYSIAREGRHAAGELLIRNYEIRDGKGSGK